MAACIADRISIPAAAPSSHLQAASELPLAGRSCAVPRLRPPLLIRHTAARRGDKKQRRGHQQCMARMQPCGASHGAAACMQPHPQSQIASCKPGPSPSHSCLLLTPPRPWPAPEHALPVLCVRLHLAPVHTGAQHAAAKGVRRRPASVQVQRAQQRLKHVCQDVRRVLPALPASQLGSEAGCGWLPPCVLPTLCANAAARSIPSEWEQQPACCGHHSACMHQLQPRIGLAQPLGLSHHAENKQLQ